jgi:hypothetical protein
MEKYLSLLNFKKKENSYLFSKGKNKIHVSEDFVIDYGDIKKSDLKGLNYDKIYNFLTKFDKEHRLERYKQLLKFNDIKFEADVFT